MHGLQQQQYCDDDISLKIPLIIADQNPQAAGGGLQQTSGNSSGNGGGAATFLKTCFNGLNALAGMYFQTCLICSALLSITLVLCKRIE